MSDHQDAQDQAARALGRLEGRVDAIDERMDRYEAAVSGRLASIDTKIDTLVTALASGLGGVRVFHWVCGLALTSFGFLANYLWRGRN